MEARGSASLLSARASKAQKRRKITVACDRCRARKTKCNGTRPTCLPCARHGQQCQYAAEPDATPIIAVKRKLEALQARGTGQQALLDALASLCEPNAQMLLRRLRDGEGVESLYASARSMLDVHNAENSLAASPDETDSRINADPMTKPSDNRSSSQPTLQRTTKLSTLFEPKIEVAPEPPNLFPSWT